jgi:hypothetical protein
VRVNWQQSLEGCSLLEIRNLLRSLRRGGDRSFSVPYLARFLGDTKHRSPTRDVIDRARRLVGGLIASGLIELNPKSSREEYELTDAGRSLCAASKTKRFCRARAEAAISKLLAVARQVNADPIFLHDIQSIAVFGSYLDDTADLGDIDVAVKLAARWNPAKGDDTDRTQRAERFERKYPPPESFYEKCWWGSWAEIYTMRLLRVDPAIKLVEFISLESLGCPYRLIFPKTKGVAAKPGWRFERHEIILVEHCVFDTLTR